MSESIQPDDLRSVLLGWGVPCTCGQDDRVAFDCIPHRMDEFINDAIVGECQ